MEPATATANVKEHKPTQPAAVLSENGKGNKSVIGHTGKGVVGKKFNKTKKSKESGEYSDNEEEESW